MHIGDWLGKRADLSPNKTALIDTLGGGAITYRAWNAQANRTANYLCDALGVRKGDRVAVLSMNCVEYLDIWFACGKLGAILQNLNWRLTRYELENIVADAAPVVFVYGADFAPMAAELAPVLKSVRAWVALGSQADPAHHAFTERESCAAVPPPETALTLDDPWVICYTGGTTGVPKGAILTHGNIAWNAINTVASWELDAGDVAILNSPLFHTGGLNVFTAPLVHAGGTSIVCRAFDANQVFDLIEQQPVSLYFGVPTMFIAMQEHAHWARADFTRLKLVISGGAPCPLPVFEKFWARGIDFKTGYGLTEAGPNTFWLPRADVRRKPGAVGFPLMHIDVKVVDAAGCECAPGVVGELLIRGPHVCAGYWNRPEESADAIRGGWLHTGDLASRDAEGYYTIAGRSKDLIISGGENIYPSEVENVMAAHPAVANAALIGVPDARWGEVGRAIVVVRAGAALGADELIAFCRERLAAYKSPKSVVFVDALPLTGAGKIDKKLLQQQHG